MNGLTDSSRPVPLTGNQLLCWNAQQFWPERPVLQDVWLFELHGTLEPDRFERAWRDVVERTDALRMVIDDTGDEPAQRFTGRPALEYVDLSTAIDPAAVLDAWVNERRTRFIDVRTACCDAALITLTADRHAWYFGTHQVMADAATAFMIFQRLADAYATGHSTAIYPSFAEHAAITYADRGTERYRDAEAYWRAKISNPCDRVSFFDPKSPSRDATAQLRVGIELGEERSEGIRRLACSMASSPQHILAAALCGYLRRLTGNDRVALAIASDGRTASTSDIAGPFTEQHAVFIAADQDDDLATLAARIGSETRDARQHASFAPGNPGGALYDVRFQYVHGAAVDFAGLPARAHWLHPGHGTELLIVTIHDFDGSGNLNVQFDFNVERFTESQRNAVINHFVNLLDAWLQNPVSPLKNIDFLPADEHASLLARATGEVDAGLAEGSLLEWIEQQTRTAPERCAVEDESGHRLSYSELWAYSERIAAALRREGIGRNDLVGVMLERSAALPGVLLGVLRSGAAYLPLDPDFPQDRVAYMIENSGAALVIGERTGASATRFLSLDQLERTDAAEYTDASLQGDDLAYVLYTSGSTGKPKGVEITHAALRNFLGSMQRQPGLGSDDVLLAVTTLSFDISGLELYLPLCAGARIFIASKETAADGYALASRLISSGATMMQATPATWRMLIDAGWRGPLRRILCGGEALPEELARGLVERAGEVWNLYGPTETTIWSTIDRVAADTPVLVGRPIANTRVYVLDSAGRLVPDGVHGEIWIAGAGVARGYRNRPDLTEERFRSDPFVPGQRMYRTGDLGRWRGDRIEHLGRVDFQVKVRGYRIELGEIESAIENLDEVRQAVVAAHGNADDRRLVAYVVFNDDRALTASELRARLSETLPQYMVPAVLVPMESFPLTPNGKVDRKRLPDPLTAGLAAPQREYVAPVGTAEEAIAAVWAELIGTERVGRHDNFFELGGHSLLVVKAVARLKRRFGEMSVTDMFQYNDLASLAAALDSAAGANTVLAGISDRARQQRAAQERLRARRAGGLR